MFCSRLPHWSCHLGKCSRTWGYESVGCAVFLSWVVILREAQERCRNGVESVVIKGSTSHLRAYQSWCQFVPAGLACARLQQLEGTLLVPSPPMKCWWGRGKTWRKDSWFHQSCSHACCLAWMQLFCVAQTPKDSSLCLPLQWTGNELPSPPSCHLWISSSVSISPLSLHPKITTRVIHCWRSIWELAGAHAVLQQRNPRSKTFLE